MAISPESFSRFRRRLLLTVATVDLLATFAVGTALWQSHAHYTSRNIAAAGNLASTIDAYLGNLMARLDVTLLSVADHVELQLLRGGRDEAALDALTRRRLAGLPQVEGVGVTNAQGQLIYPRLAGTPFDVGERDYFQRARQNRDAGLIIGGPLRSLRTGAWSIVLVRRINGADGTFAGVALIDLPLEVIAAPLKQVDLGPEGAVVIRSAELDELVRYPGDIDRNIRSRTISAEFRSLLASGAHDGQYRAVSPVDGIERLQAFRRLANYPFYVTVGFSTATADTEWRRDAAPAALLLLVFLGLTGLMARFVLQTTRRQENATQLVVARENELRKLTAAVEQSPSSIVITDTSGTIEYVNEAFTRASGYSLDEARGRNPRVLQSGQTPPEVYQGMWDTLRAGKIWRGELLNRAKDGHLYSEFEIICPIRREDGVVTHYLAIKEDITQRKQMHQRLEELGRHLQDILDAASEVSIIATDASGLITVFNRGAERMLGYRSEEMVGRQTPAPLHLAEEIEQRGAELSRHFGRPVSGFRVFVELAEREGSERREWTYVTRHHLHLTVSLVVTAVRDAGGAITGYLGIAQDITERKRAEAELRRAVHAAEEANRAKSQFLANMSHEIRTPMNGVIGMTQLLGMTELSDEQREYADTIRDSAESLLAIINDILDFSKVEAGKLRIEYTAFAPRELLHHVAELFAPQLAGKSLRLEIRVAEGVPERLVGDPGRVRQILTNLISNAIKFTAAGGIDIDVSDEAASEDGLWLRIVVRDSGIGMDDDTLARLFSPFYQADASTTRRFGGTGLGLSISQRLAELMGGRIDVESTPGEGSTFTVRLPCALAATAPAAAADAPALPAEGSTPLRVLLAEDNPTNQRVIEQLLGKLGVRADLVDDGAAVLQRLREAPYDLVLMDCQMPVMDGFTATRRIRAGEAGEQNRDVRIVALTANAMAGDREACIAAGMDDYLAKPVALAELAARLGHPGLPPAPPGAATAGHFSATTLLANVVNDRELARLVVRSTLEDLPRYMAEGEAALAAGNWADALRIAHTLASLGGQVGGAPFSAVCRGIEATLRDQHLPDDAAVAALRSSASALIAALNDWLTHDH